MPPITPRTAPAEMTFSSAARAASPLHAAMATQQSRPAPATARAVAAAREMLAARTRTRAHEPADRDRMVISLRRNSLELVGHLVEARRGADFVLVLTRRAAHADGADRVLTDLDGDAAAQRDHVRETSLPGQIRALGGALRPFHRAAAEGQSRIGLAAGELDIGEARPVALQVGAKPPHAVEHRNRDAVAVLLALSGRGFDDGQGHARGHVLVREHLRVRGARDHEGRNQPGYGARSKPHDIPPLRR